MGLWVQTAGLVLAAVGGVIAGTFFSRLRKRFWILGYAIPMILILILLTARYNPWYGFVAPISWITAGRIRFVVYAFVVTMGLTAPFSRLPHRFEKVLVLVLMTVFVVCFSIVPFTAPAFFRETLSGLTTNLDSDGICLQSTLYTCGPAAAVTALKQLGLPADEGELAVLSYSSPITGTLPGALCTALENKYHDQGLECQYRGFDSIRQLNAEGITLAIVRDAFLWDHCIAILQVSDSSVTVADPVYGRMSIPRNEFRKIWRFCGIVLKRNYPRST